jgi:uncharacterized membrane protein
VSTTKSRKSTKLACFLLERSNEKIIPNYLLRVLFKASVSKILSVSFVIAKPDTRNMVTEKVHIFVLVQIIWLVQPAVSVKICYI